MSTENYISISPRISQKLDIYLNEQGVYKQAPLAFSFTMEKGSRQYEQTPSSPSFRTAQIKLLCNP